VNKLRVESVVAVEGVVRPRPSDAINADMKTGAIEVYLMVFVVLLFWEERARGDSAFEFENLHYLV
jgi:aspartyl-tRNA synthetase